LNKKTLTIRIPDALKRKLDKITSKQGISLNQFALYTFTKEVAEYEVKSYFKHYIKRKSKKKIFNDFDSVLQKINDRELPGWDKL